MIQNEKEQVISARLEIKSDYLRERIERIVGAFDEFRVYQKGESDRADLLIFELGADPAKDFQFIQSLLDVEAVSEVFLISLAPADQNLLLQAMRLGVKEFFSDPIREADIRAALQKCKERKEKADSLDSGRGKRGKIIHVIGSKGGVGTTTVSVNLANSIAEINPGQSVALMDMNLLLGEVPLFLDMEPTCNWGEIASNIHRLDTTYLMSFLIKHSSGMYILPSPCNLNGGPVATPEIMEGLLSLMRTMFDYVVIDGGQSMDEVALKIHQMSDFLLLVSVLSLPCLTNSNRLLNIFQSLDYPPKENIKLVINRFLKKSDITLGDVEKSVNKGVFWTIPNDYFTTMTAINQGKPLSQAARKAAVTKNIRKLAETLVGSEGAQRKKKKGWLF